jgi:hypothetical protein
VSAYYMLLQGIIYIIIIIMIRLKENNNNNNIYIYIYILNWQNVVVNNDRLGKALHNSVKIWDKINEDRSEIR